MTCRCSLRWKDCLICSSAFPFCDTQKDRSKRSAKLRSSPVGLSSRAVLSNSVLSFVQYSSHSGMDESLISSLRQLRVVECSSLAASLKVCEALIESSPSSSLPFAQPLVLMMTDRYVSLFLCALILWHAKGLF